MSSDIAGLILQATLAYSTKQLNKSVEVLSTGYKINRASDDAAGYYIAKGLSTQISSLIQDQKNADDGMSLLSTASGSLDNITNLLQKLRDLSVQASSGTLDTQSRNAMQAQADSIVEQINQIKQTTNYNGINLFETPKSTTTTTTAAVAAFSQASPTASLDGAMVSIDGEDVSSTTLDSLLTTSDALPTTLDSLPTTSDSLSTISDALLTTSEDLFTTSGSFGMSAMSMMAMSAMASGTIDGSIDFAAGETKNIQIDGVTYTVKNRQGVASNLSYSKDTGTGALTFLCSLFEIRGETDVAHNIIINGASNYVYTGDLADTITTANSLSKGNYIYAGAGDDTITDNGNWNNVLYGEAGNDTINAKGAGANIYGGEGNDIFNVTAGRTIIYGGNGNDIFNVSSSTNTLYGEGDEDTFNINSGTSNLVDGGAGTNAITDHGSGTITTNVPGANSTILNFTGLQTQTVTINGIGYTIKNNSSGGNTLIYSVDSGVINFKRGTSFSVTSDRTKANNIIWGLGSSSFYGSDQVDNITLQGADGDLAGNNTIYGYGGDDIITVSTNNNKIFGGDGNDTISVSDRNIVYGENGNDNITLKSGTWYAYADGGIGDDNITVASGRTNAVVIGGDGINTIIDNGTSTIKSGFSEVIDNADTLSFASGETKALTINGINYTIKNNLGSANTLAYSYNPVTNEITFGGAYMNITGQRDVQHNIKLYGYATNLYTGNLDDKVVDYGQSNTIYTYGGNDTVVINGLYSTVYGGAGDDNLTLNRGNGYGEAGNDTITVGTADSANGGDGDDIYNINYGTTVNDNAGNNTYNMNCSNANITGGMGNDTFYVTGNNNTVKGGGGDDYFVIDGTGNNIVDGGTGANYYVDNSSGGTTVTNIAVDPNSGMLNFTSVGETQTFVMDGKTYSVVNQNADGTALATNRLKYYYNSNTGAITLEGSDFTVTSIADQSNNLFIRGDNNTVNGSNLVDRVTIESGTNNVINGNDGDDVITSSSTNNSILGGNGNDAININATTTKSVSGGAGNDTITINSDNNTNINTGSGNDNVTVNGSANTIDVTSGDNSVLTTGNNNNIKASNGNNTLSAVGNSNTITAGTGNNTLGVQGNNNTTLSQGGDTNFNIYGDSNTTVSTGGDGNVVVKGYSNTVNTATGDDKFQVTGNSNVVTTTGGANSIKVKGDLNTYNGGVDVDSISISGDQNIANGGNSNDTFLIGKGDQNTIDGEAGDRNTMINNGTNTVFTNVVDITPNPFVLNLKIDTGSSSNSYITTSISFNLFDFGVDFSSVESATDSIDRIDDMLSTVQDQITNVGVTMNKLSSIIDSQSVKMTNLISSRSTIQDADIAKETSKYIRFKILQQAAVALMTQSKNIKNSYSSNLLMNAIK